MTQFLNNANISFLAILIRISGCHPSARSCPEHSFSPGHAFKCSEALVSTEISSSGSVSFLSHMLLSFHRVLGFSSPPQPLSSSGPFKIYKRDGWRDGSAAESSCCFCRRPGFGSQRATSGNSSSRESDVPL